MKKPLRLPPTMKKPLVLTCLLGLASSLHANSYNPQFTTGFANGGVIRDGNVTGWSDTRIVSGIAENSILDLNVWLDFTGGWNGDLYAYLTHDTGFSVLLNRPGRTAGDGFGYGDAGLSVVLDDSALLGDIHGYQGVAGYPPLIQGNHPWQPDGRNANPVTVLDTTSRTAWLSSFQGLDPNGAWTLFVADLSNGEVSTIEGWGLQITTEGSSVSVPETGGTTAGWALGFLCLSSARFLIARTPPRKA